jgi:hypothetical protein
MLMEAPTNPYVLGDLLRGSAGAPVDHGKSRTILQAFTKQTQERNAIRGNADIMLPSLPAKTKIKARSFTSFT